MTTQTYNVHLSTTAGINDTMCNRTTANESICDSNITMTTKLKRFDDYDQIFRDLWTYPAIIILIIGTIGHVLTFAVIGSSRYLRQLSSSVYLVAMSIAGIIALYTGLLRHVIYFGISNWNVELEIRRSSEAMCKFHMFITYFSLQYFAWIQATISVDRLICVLKPHRYRLSCKWMSALVICIVEFVVALGINSIVVKEAHLNDKGSCHFKDMNFYRNGWTYIDLLSFSLIPATIMIVCNTFILVVLRQLKSRLGATRADSMSRSLTMMLMSLNLIFLITTLPISVVTPIEWGSNVTKRFAIIELCWACFSLLQYLGAASTFLIYCFTGPQFREEMWALFGCTKRCKKNAKSRISKSITKQRENNSMESSHTQLTVMRSTSNSLKTNNGHELVLPKNNNVLSMGSINGHVNVENGLIQIQECSDDPDMENSPSREKLIQKECEVD